MASAADWVEEHTGVDLTDENDDGDGYDLADAVDDVTDLGSLFGG